MNATNATIDSLFNGGPPLKIEKFVHMVKPDDPAIARRALIVALIGWAPLLALTAAQELVHHNGSLRDFLQDYGAYGRFVLAAPIFILAEGWCLPALGRITRRFIDFGIVRNRDREGFEAAVTTTRRLLHSTLPEILTVVLAYAATFTLRISVHLPNLPHWAVQQPEGPDAALTAAGLWQLWISFPLLFILVFGWMWRQFLWCRLMWRIAGFDLDLIAAHPDRAGGLKFLGSALWGYCPLALALGTILAGGVANHIRQGASVYDFRFFILGLLLFVLALFVGPFLIFTPVLRGLRSRGTVEYGTLSCVVGHEFESKWIQTGSRHKSEALEAPDFSATTDLYSIASNVYQMRYLPLGSRQIAELIIFTLLPFVPVVLLSVPLDTVLQQLKQILL